MRVVSLGSGSSGNAYLVEAGPQGRTRLLLDAGLSARMLTTRLASVGVSPLQLQGILVTHEHSDHVRGIPVLVKNHSLPVIANTHTLKAIQEGIVTGVWSTDSGKLVPAYQKSDTDTQPEVLLTKNGADTANAALLESQPGQIGVAVADGAFSTSPASQYLFSALVFPSGTRRIVGDITITSFAISHDATAPCGYLLEAGGCRVCLVTDSGEVTLAMLEQMQHADLLILESNHDRERLRRGPYPWMLKRRILSPTGHLANDQAAEAVLRIWREGGMRWLWLAHLSRTNNTPQLALENMRLSLLAAHVNLSYIQIVALPPTMGAIWDSTRLWL
ncbi:MBL fold metallo-hydrolase [Dictyobacter arantiisoli]|uniref:Metallo-beta-lactamase domain-containing protein n=1 Tax=Dictyobacter arantiisoli TaxID=2014874 RepID=A0A5A5TEM0_9CHLR|nr:MBL fold metallo-hydrolase [Dictyobacter arantiisoli]GCF09675.1 hypothetical protein KDI_32390 [Dictyobacter arantiisoli]